MSETTNNTEVLEELNDRLEEIEKRMHELCGYLALLEQVGDTMQSAMSRVGEWAFKQPDMDSLRAYETYMAVLEGRSAVKEWTAIRSSKRRRTQSQ